MPPRLYTHARTHACDHDSNTLENASAGEFDRRICSRFAGTKWMGIRERKCRSVHENYHHLSSFFLRFFPTHNPSLSLSLCLSSFFFHFIPSRQARDAQSGTTQQPYKNAQYVQTYGQTNISVPSDSDATHSRDLYHAASARRKLKIVNTFHATAIFEDFPFRPRGAYTTHTLRI